MELKNIWNTIIIGGGQAGLATGYYLKQKNSDFIILDENKDTGAIWRNRWDSLKVFTPAQFNGLPGIPFPGGKGYMATKNEVADYLKNYKQEFDLPVLYNTKANKLSKEGNQFIINCNSGKFLANNVVVATGTNPLPKVPRFSAELSEKVFQVHSANYKNPGMLPAGDALVVGSGTSGVEIAIEISKSRKTYISGKPTFHIPDAAFKYGGNIYWWFICNIVTIKTPIGKKAKEKFTNGGAPLISVSVKDLEMAKVERLPRVSGIKDGYPMLEDGRILPVASVIWATGFKPNFSWIQLEAGNYSSWPSNKRGVSSDVHGLYFIGTPFQFALTSGLIGGVGRDAQYISEKIND